MGIKKVTVYVCDNSTCDKEGEDESQFATDVQVQRGDAKKKVVLCDDCKDELDELMGRYFEEGDGEDETSDEVVVPADYDPMTYAKMQDLSPEDRVKHFEAKKWALGPDSTMAKTTRPEGVRGKAGPKVLAAYEAYLKREADLAAEIEAGIAASNGKTT